MLQFLYPISFFVSLAGLIFWFYSQGNPARSRPMSQLFLGGFLVYLFSLAFSSGELPHKLFILFRDLMVLGVVSQFFNLLKKNKLLFFSMLAALYGTFHFFGFDYMRQSLAQTTTPPAITEAPATSALTEGELLVDIKEDHQFGELKNIIEKYGLRYERAFYPEHADQTNLDDYFLVDIPTQNEALLAEIEQAFLNSGLVDWAEENDQVQIDPMESIIVNRKGRSYGLNDPEVTQLWGFEAMQIDKLYAVLENKKIKPQRKALIAILDTGVDAAHEDLKDNYHSLNTKYDTDQAGHGTHCAGIAAAVSNNKKGVASFSQNNDFVEVASIRVLSSFGSGTQQGIIKGIIEAADKGADVISLSLGGPSTRSRQKAYEDAVEYASKAGAIVVVAAGNSNANAAGYSPANTPGVITVSAVDTLVNRAHFSNFVTDVSMGIAAPGVAIYSTIPGSKYSAFNGTSMATPYVSGLVGLLKSIQPKLTTKEVYDILEKTGKATGDTGKTGKLIQPAEAVAELVGS